MVSVPSKIVDFAYSRSSPVFLMEKGTIGNLSPKKD